MKGQCHEKSNGKNRRGGPLLAYKKTFKKNTVPGVMIPPTSAFILATSSVVQSGQNIMYVLIKETKICLLTCLKWLIYLSGDFSYGNQWGTKNYLWKTGAAAQKH